jgi:nucleoside-diphosphate-sugar epimerase
MNVLLVGGSGHVGSFITPYLKQKHRLRVLDVRPPKHEGVDYVEGSVTDEASIRRAVQGVDSFVWLVMKSPQGGSVTDQTPQVIVDNYTVNNLGLHLFLWLAQGAGVKNGVYTSSMSVHYRERPYYFSEEETPYDTPSAYGLSKGFGEQICRYFARWFDMNLIALRITGPRTRQQWTEERKKPRLHPGGARLYPTDEEDLANAYLAALEAVQTGHGRFDAFFIAGDEKGESHNMSKARRVLGWEPRTHLKVDG